MSLKALIIDDDPKWRRELQRILVGAQFDVELSANIDDAWPQLGAKAFSVVILNVGLTGGTNISWLNVLHHIRDNSSTTKVFIVTGDPTLDTAMEAINTNGIAPAANLIRKMNCLGTA